MVIENPIQLTIVSEDPRDSSGAFCATKEENKGESAITASPQKKRNAINTEAEGFNKNSGERIQHRQDKSSEIVAILFAP